MSKSVTNISASARQRLLNLARDRNEDFGLLLMKYGLERLLFRISQSQHRLIFILKGALLFEQNPVDSRSVHRVTLVRFSLTLLPITSRLVPGFGHSGIVHQRFN